MGQRQRSNQKGVCSARVVRHGTTAIPNLIPGLPRPPTVQDSHSCLLTNLHKICSQAEISSFWTFSIQGLFVFLFFFF